MSAAFDSPQDEPEVAESSAIVPQRAAPPPPPPRLNIPPPPQDELPPPYDALASRPIPRLLAGWQPSQKPPEERFVSATNNRNPETTNGRLRTCTRHLTVRNLLIAFAVLLALIGSTAFLFYFLGGDRDDRWIEDTRLAIRNGDESEGGRVGQIAETAFSVRFVPPSTASFMVTPATTERLTVPLRMGVRWKQPFTITQHMSFDKASDAIILSTYNPEDLRLESEQLVVGNHRRGFVYKSLRTPAGYARCSRLSEDFMCCATYPQTDEYKTDCFDVYKWNNHGRAFNVSAPHYDYVDYLLSPDGYKRIVLSTGQQHALLDVYLRNLCFSLCRIYPVEDNRLPAAYISVGFAFPMDDTFKLDELVRGKDFEICKYDATSFANRDAKLRRKSIKKAKSVWCLFRFNVDNELPKVKFCSNPIFTAVVQYGHRGREGELTFFVELVFNGEDKVYTLQESLQTPYDQLVLNCNRGTLDIYVMGERQIVAFDLELSNIRSE
ncbi:hypothetical protein M3Y99_00913300 [Aphelenchoides fujianensis]|nr:hypothetical protein M3Y99_00913300 [Aphelenchoides fujianensis]